jgi:hypothetical protein
MTLPAEFSWLKPACRPSPQEVEAYAAAIASMGVEFAGTEESRHREAELQLWIWRTEHEIAIAPPRRGPPARAGFAWCRR